MFARVGSGAPRCPASAVVLVHGLVISSLYMVPSARRLAEHFPVLAPDLPGFGRSGKPRQVLTIPELADALAAWMGAVGLSTAALVANSLGCQVVVDLAVRRPELVEALVLAGPTMDPSARRAGVQVGRWLRDWPLERPSLALAHARDYLLAGARRALQTFRHALADRIEAKLPRVQAPTLVVRGSRDPIVPQRWAEEAAALLPGGRLVVIPGGPHCVNYSTPDAFARVVRTFLAGATA
jgi:2-hydroxy-6-oxonona-2,4-dienedioate hydrolase